MRTGKHYPFIFECLENRQLLSGVIDTTFGAQGLAGGVQGPLKVLANGQILIDVNGSGKIVRLNANGSVDSTFNSAGVVDTWKTGTALQPDGKYLILSGQTLTRYNANGSVDTTFAAGGHLAAWYVNSNFASFVPVDVAMSGSQIIVAGNATVKNHPGDMTYAIERYNSNGKIDQTFGLHWQRLASGQTGSTVRVVVGSNGRTWSIGNDNAGIPDVIKWGSGGPDNSGGTMAVLYSKPFSSLPAAPVTEKAVDISLQANGLPVITLSSSTGHPEILRLELSMKIDPTLSDSINGLAIEDPRGNQGSWDYSSVPLAVAVQSNGELLLGLSEGTLRLFATTTGDSAGISGRVFHDVNGDGIRQSSEAAVSGVTVTLQDNHGPTLTTVSDGNGLYSFPALPAGTRATITYQAPAGFLATADGEHNQFTISPTQNVLNLGVAHPAIITGTVYYDATRSGIFEPGDLPASGVIVQATAFTGFDLGEVGVGVNSAADGTFTLLAAPGTEALGVQTSNTASLFATSPFPILDLTEGESIHLNFLVTKIANYPTSISGYVFNDVNGDGKQESTDPGLKGWQVYVDLDDSGVYKPADPIATTDSAGHYVLNLPADAAPTYVIREVRQSGWNRTQPGGNWPGGAYEVTFDDGPYDHVDFGNQHI
jgi:uncharacterized delta-60 repeat protein